MGILPGRPAAAVVLPETKSGCFRRSPRCLPQGLTGRPGLEPGGVFEELLVWVAVFKIYLLERAHKRERQGEGDKGQLNPEIRT